MNKQSRWSKFSLEELEALKLHLSFSNAIASPLAVPLMEEIHAYLHPTPDQRGKYVMEQICDPKTGRIKFEDLEPLLVQQIREAEEREGERCRASHS